MTLKLVNIGHNDDVTESMVEFDSVYYKKIFVNCLVLLFPLHGAHDENIVGE